MVGACDSGPAAVAAYGGGHIRDRVVDLNGGQHAATIAFGIPRVVLALGASLVWAFSGFAAKRA